MKRVSRIKGRDKKLQFDRLCKDMVRRKFNRILVWYISRLGRSLQHLVKFLNDVQSVNRHLYIHQSGLDTSTPSGRMMFKMVGVFSKFERSIISERAKLDIKRVKFKGIQLRRPKSITAEMKEKNWMMASLYPRSQTSLKSQRCPYQGSTKKDVHDSRFNSGIIISYKKSTSLRILNV